MICFLGNRPVLQVYHYQVASYGDAWLREALQIAMQHALGEEAPFLNDIMAGIWYYLENNCSLRLLPVEDLTKKIRYMLGRVGLSHLAENLPPLAPPVSLSLLNIVREVGEGFEMGLFDFLNKEILALKHHGVPSLYFEEIKEGVKVLQSTEDWNAACRRLSKEFIDFLSQYGSLSTEGELIGLSFSSHFKKTMPTI